MTATELARVDRGAPIVPLDTRQVAAAMTAYQDGLKSILDETDWQTFEEKRTGETRAFLKRSGWRKIAFWFGLDLDVISTDVERDPQGNPLRARVIARATHPNGRHADGDGYCSIRERGFSKPENDIPATAATRAMNRAISNLVGMGQISAEEVDGVEPAAHEYGAPASRQDRDGLARAAVALRTDADVPQLLERLERDAGGYLPRIAARAVMLVAAHRPARPDAPAPAGETGADGRPEDTPAPDDTAAAATGEVTAEPQDPAP